MPRAILDMAIEQLTTLVPPPATPLDASGDWDLVRTRLTSLPNDYREIVSTYGRGRFGNFIRLFTPFAGDPYENIVEQGRIIRTAHEAWRSRGVPNFFPKPGGLLPFAITDNGDYICWETGSDLNPDSWLVTIFPRSSIALERTPFSASAFLVQVLSRRYQAKSFPDTFPSMGPIFATHYLKP